jgi:hypothetical protein
MQALTPAAYPFACASARPLRSVGCRPQSLGRHPRRTAIAASDALAQPQEGHAQANADGVRRSAAATEDGVAGFGSGLSSIPASQPLLSRRRRIVTPKVSPTGAAFTCALLCVAIPAAGLSPQSSPGGQRPRDPPTADRRHPVTAFPRAVFAALTCLQSRPPARLFSFETARRAVRAAQACPHWRSPRCGSVEGLYESRRYNQQPDPSTPTQTRHHTTDQHGTSTLRVFPFTGQARSLRAAPVAPPRGRGVTPAAMRSVHRRNALRSLLTECPSEGGGTRFKSVLCLHSRFPRRLRYGVRGFPKGGHRS